MSRTKTVGELFAVTLRELHHVGTRTRWNRNGWEDGNDQWRLRAEMASAIIDATVSADWFEAADAVALRPGYAPILGWERSVDGGRVEASELRDLSPYRWAAMLGEMVDANVTNVGEAEEWFREHAILTVVPGSGQC